MKKLLLLLFVVFYAMGFTSYELSANTPFKPSEELFTPQISVTGPDMMTVIANGDMTPDMFDGTMYPELGTGNSLMTPFSILNNGASDLNISNITITGTNASDFVLNDMWPVTVLSGTSESIEISFAPQSAGVKNAIVTITSDDPTNGTYTFAIQGTAFEGATGLHFDGIDDNITFNNGNYSLNDDFTIEFWMKPNISGTEEHFILDNTSGSAGYSLRIDITQQLNFTFFTSTGANNLMTPPIANDQWQHVVITHNGTNYRILIDGIEENRLTLSEAIVDSSNNLTMGSAFGGGEYYAGAIDELRVWDIALSNCRISDQSSCQLTGSESDLIAYYNFNNGEVNGNNFPEYSILDPNHTITSGIPPQGTLNNFGLSGTTSNWIDTTANGISGSCSTYTEAIISIASNSNAINNGDTTVSSSNNTSFGNVIFGQAEPADYTISNTGNITLDISNITIDGASDFTIIESPTDVAAGTSGNLRILFTPSSIGTKNATVRISNNGCDTTFTFAIEGTGYTPATGISLDGTDDHININHNSAFNTNTFTIEAYFKTTSTAGGQSIIGKYDATGINGFSMNLSSSGVLRFEYAVPNNESTSLSNASGLNDGNWHHIALAFGDGKAIFYIDGVLDNEITFSNIPETPTNTESLYIGYSAFNNVYFNGDIDEVRYWSRALCSDEILAQQGCELAGNESGLVAYYKLNQGNVAANNSSETTLDDATSNSLDGTLTNFGLTGNTSNWINTTANGISGNCSIAIPEINVQGNGNDILNGDTTPETSDNTDAGSINVGSTKEMSFFVRNTDGSAALNIDGVILTGDTADFTITQNPHNNPIPATESASLKIEFAPTSGGTKTATVIIDSDDCDEPSYSFTIQGTAIPLGTGLDFDGANDLVTIPHNTSQNNLNFSVDFWIKTTDGLGGVINKFTPDGNNGWRINLDGGRIEFYYYASATNYITRLLSPATKVDDGEWHHVAVTLNSGNARCYIDGTLARSTGWVGTATATTTTADIQLGYAVADTPSGDTGGYFNGQLDELRIWTKTLSAFEVSELNGCTADMSQTDLVARYNFNTGISGADNSGLTTLADGSGNSYNGTLINFALSGATSNWIDASSNNISESCDCVVAGGITLTTQAEVDSYIATLGTCGIIEGNVTINGTITDVSGFSNVNTISGNLHLEGNIVDDLSGFASLTTIGGNFTLKDMTNTTSIASFSNVTSLGGNLTIDNLDLLTEITILDQITTIPNIEITDNALLTTITLNQLQTMTGSFRITFNSSLSTLSIDQLTQVNGEFRVSNIGSGLTSISLPLLEGSGNFRIADATGLISIDAPEILNLTGACNIGGCANLTTVNFPKLTSIGNNLSIDNSPSLNSITATVLSTISGAAQFHDMAVTDLSFLSGVTSIGGNLSLTDMTALNTIQGMDNLTTLGGFNISDCDLVPNLEGFPKLAITSINSLNIAENELITTFDNSFLASLTSIGILGISFNGNLVEIDALQNVASLTGSDSTIRNNNSLQSINLYALRNVGSNLIIRDQDLGITNLCGLYDYVTTGDGATTLSFQGSNQTAWDSVQDITDNCETPIITLIGDNPQTIELGDGYTELGASTSDSSTVIIDASDFTDAVGSYTITYNAVGLLGNNAAEVTRTVNVVDTTAPVITLTGDNPQTIELGDGYTELGATTDDGTNITIDTTAFMDVLGSYTIRYNATDASNNAAAEVTRTVNVVNTTAPVITLIGDNPQIIELGDGYTELGANTDDGTAVVIDDSDFVDAVGSYTIRYNATDASNNVAVEVIRTVNVVDTTAPVITLTGDNPQTIELGDGYTELGATIDDGSSIIIDTSDFVDAVGSYTIRYNATDASNNAAVEVTRTVNVVDTTAPVITLTGDNPQTIELGNGYTELGATTDDGTTVTIDTTAFMDALGSYTIRYNATDASNNVAAEVTRTVNVVNNVPPIITLLGDNPQTIVLGDGYTELGATTDDGSEVIIDTSDFVDALGTYMITYNSTDASNNVAVEVIRTVHVVSGCPIFDLPADNFLVEAYSETCEDKDNGNILVRATEEQNYIATINNNTYDFGTDLFVQDLAPGTYTLCIAIDGYSDCEQCFEVAIEEAPILEGKTILNTDNKSNQIYVEIDEGTAPYTVMINDTMVATYDTNSFYVEVQHGDTLEVFSSQACEGKLSTKITLFDQITVSPNPTRSDIVITIPETVLKTITVDIHSALGIKVSSNTYSITEGKVVLPMETLPSGVYFISLMNGASKTFRIVKQ
ncbi:LamG-like jellyroll fold domain-containing protein [Aquimarina sp. 2304DJ70-9]|uniref:LamG-like jellyroll fold domain-containing protein n=1 Tax=Aquimarina penaris TaxID=3231044 RepID=UPI003461CE44